MLVGRKAVYFHPLLCLDTQHRFIPLPKSLLPALPLLISHCVSFSFSSNDFVPVCAQADFLVLFPPQQRVVGASNGPKHYLVGGRGPALPLLFHPPSKAQEGEREIKKGGTVTLLLVKLVVLLLLDGLASVHGSR